MSIFLDADFRRTPKTDRFCHACQKDLTHSAKAVRVWICDDMQSVVAPGDPDAELTVLLGADCAKKAKIPADWFVTEST